ncbi:right-handed parallel beta-helix repeat-containing protein [Actinotalea sp. BY-33]|uniref:Right-handed parallel beta-helix repeat-containing protein n=1 Tax=Actinotalea soli TaxID=2819234 RepID=A0A939RVU6_9CELL|nr:right-handed parallel beta-helix repeat-containing protein [Actinotalea soli]MBO1751988.1 right-handed parallel beta-helix repeat-containing protein [Actinotalea soli]
MTRRPRPLDRALGLGLGVAVAGLLAACSPPSPDPGAAATPSATSDPTSPEDQSPVPPDRADWPDDASTGVTEGVDLRERTPGTWDASSTAYEGVLVPGDVTLTGDDVVLRDVRVEGHLLVTGDSVVLENAEVATLSISGATNVTVRSTEVFGLEGEDGIHLTSDRGRVADIVIEDSWIHSPKVTESSHYDGIQVRGVDRLTFRGNAVELGPHTPELNAAVFLEQANGDNFDVVIEDNWLDGGGFPLYLSGTGVTVAGNVIGPARGYGLVYPDAEPQDLVQDGNVLGEDGAAATLEW